MSEEIKITLPKLGESIVSATIVQWFKKEGDPVRLDEPLLEVSTDKVNSEIPSPVAGVVTQILAKTDEELQVGDLLAIISKQGSAQMTSAGEPSSLGKEASEQAHEQVRQIQGEYSDFLSPAVLRLAHEKGIPIEELKKIPTTGGGGRLSKQDLEAYIENKKSVCRQTATPKPACPHAVTEDIEKLKMSGMRKAIAENMVKSFYEAPHATLVAEVDVTAVLKLIQEHKESFLAKHGFKITITTFIAKAIVKALQEFPLINSSLEQDTILVKRFVNLGIAVSIEQGLIVPVIKNCQRLSTVELAKAVSELSTKARGNKLSPSDVMEGTITMTNFGMSGVAIGIPIIRYPEVAIIGVGAIQKRVAVLEDDSFAIRSFMHLSLTFDHRVLDGMYGCGFLASVKKHLETDAKIEA